MSSSSKLVIKPTVSSRSSSSDGISQVMFSWQRFCSKVFRMRNSCIIYFAEFPLRYSNEMQSSVQGAGEETYCSSHWRARSPYSNGSLEMKRPRMDNCPLALKLIHGKLIIWKIFRVIGMIVTGIVEVLSVRINEVQRSGRTYYIESRCDIYQKKK